MPTLMRSTKSKDLFLSQLAAVEGVKEEIRKKQDELKELDLKLISKIGAAIDTAVVNPSVVEHPTLDNMEVSSSPWRLIVSIIAGATEMKYLRALISSKQLHHALEKLKKANKVHVTEGGKITLPLRYAPAVRKPKNKE